MIINIQQITLLSIGFLLTSCTTKTANSIEDSGTIDNNVTDSGSDETDQAEESPDYSINGDFTVDIAEKTISVASCSSPIAYTVFTPQNTTSDTVIMLSHGFARNQDVMKDVARHWASWGLPTVTVDLCHSGFWDNEPNLDASEMLTIRQTLETNSVIYAGYSAGGLRSVLAAANDNTTRAVLGLDLVDWGAETPQPFLAQETAASLTIPVYGVHGESSDCNASGNGFGVYQNTNNSMAIRVTEADHCNFEAPTDGICTFVCSEENVEFPEEEIISTIRVFSTSFLLWQTGISTDAADVWTPGTDSFQYFIDSGRIQLVE